MIFRIPIFSDSNFSSNCRNFKQGISWVKNYHFTVDYQYFIPKSTWKFLIIRQMLTPILDLVIFQSWQNYSSSNNQIVNHELAGVPLALATIWLLHIISKGSTGLGISTGLAVSHSTERLPKGDALELELEFPCWFCCVWTDEPLA